MGSNHLPRVGTTVCVCVLRVIMRGSRCLTEISLKLESRAWLVGCTVAEIVVFRIVLNFSSNIFQDISEISQFFESKDDNKRVLSAL